jgi:glycosyltransferase involved in cell wall biosynthesis
MTYTENPFLLALFILFSAATLIQLFYYLFFYLPVWIYKPSPSSAAPGPVSVIICARNEAENLKNFLPSVLEQDYPDYEVIVVNDCSEDSSYLVLGEYIQKYPHLKISTVNKDPKFTHYKRFAQFIGIKAAKNEILLFTDADCSPVSKNWIRNMAGRFDSKTGFVLGYGGYIRNKGLLNAYIRYDTMTIAMQYLGMAIRKMPYMGVGRNLSYRRSLNHLISGDDDLFVNSNATGKNTSVEFTSGSFTRSVPVKSVREWIVQKKRHLTTAPYYRTGDKILLAAEPISRLLFYSSFIILLSFNYLWPFVLGIFGLRLLTQLIIYILIPKKLNELGLTVYSLFFDIFSPVINFVVYLSNFRSRPVKTRWK